MALTEEEKQKIIEEEELRAKTRQKIQNEYSTDGTLSFFWFDDSPLGQFKSFAFLMFLIILGTVIVKIFE